MIKRALLENGALHQANWMYIQQFLFQCIVIDPFNLYPVLTALQAAHNQGYVVEKVRLEKLLNLEIIQRCPLRQTHEVAWAIWAIIYWELRISDEAAKLISKIPNSIVALSALHARQEGCVSNLDTSLWESYLEKEALYKDQWLLAYEACIKGWLKPTKNFIEQEQFFDSMKQNSVIFYDTTLAKQATLTGASFDSNYPFFSFLGLSLEGQKRSHAMIETW